MQNYPRLAKLILLYPWFMALWNIIAAHSAGSRIAGYWRLYCCFVGALYLLLMIAFLMRRLNGVIIFCPLGCPPAC